MRGGHGETSPNREVFPPAGEWLLLDAASAIGDEGTGLAERILSDVAGECGRTLQTLVVAPR